MTKQTLKAKAQRKNILIVLHLTDLSGGPNNNIRNLLPQFAASKYAYHFLTPGPGAITKLIKEAGLSLTMIKHQVISKVRFVAYLRCVLHTYRFLRRERIDLAHFHYDRYRDAYFLACKLARIPTLIYAKAALQDPKLSWLQHADAIIYNSEFTKTKSVHPAGRPAHILPNAIAPASRHAPAADISRANNQPLRIITVCRIAPEKNLELLVSTLSLLKEELNFQAEIIGNLQNEDYHQKILAAVEMAGLSKLVRFTGHYSAHEQIYGSADMMIHCNPDEPFGIVFLEAAQFAVPIITLNSGGAEEVLNPDCAYLAGQTTAEALAAEVRLCCNDPALRATKLRNALARIGDFNPDSIIKKTELIYQQHLRDDR